MTVVIFVFDTGTFCWP